MSADPIVDLFDAFVEAHPFEVDVYISGDSREGGRDLDPVGESGGHCVGANALYEAGRALLWPDGILKGRGGSIAVRRCNDLE